MCLKKSSVSPSELGGDRILEFEYRSGQGQDLLGVKNKHDKHGRVSSRISPVEIIWLSNAFDMELCRCARAEVQPCKSVRAASYSNDLCVSHISNTNFM